MLGVKIIMTQLPFSGEQAIALEELEQYINQQALLVSVESGASYSIKSQTRNFLTSDDKPDIPIPGSAASEQPLFEPLKHLLIGGSKAVTSTIQYLHRLGYAQVGDWSPLLPTVNPGEVMSILSKQIVVQ